MPLLEYHGCKPDTPMKTNVGSYDAAVRFVIGLLALGWGAHYENWWGLLGLIPVITAACAVCPLYSLLHLSTTFTDRPRHHS